MFHMIDLIHKFNNSFIYGMLYILGKKNFQILISFKNDIFAMQLKQLICRQLLARGQRYTSGGRVGVAQHPRGYDLHSLAHGRAQQHPV